MTDTVTGTTTNREEGMVNHFRRICFHRTLSVILSVHIGSKLSFAGTLVYARALVEILWKSTPRPATGATIKQFLQGIAIAMRELKGPGSNVEGCGAGSKLSNRSRVTAITLMVSNLRVENIPATCAAGVGQLWRMKRI